MLHAVVVGIDEYADNRIPNLSCATHDADAIADMIVRTLHPQDRSVICLKNSDATTTAIKIAVAETLPVQARGEDDLVIFFFAGHGMPETSLAVKRSSRFLVTHDTDYDSVFSTAIDLESDLLRWFARIEMPALTVFFIDSCFSGRAGGRTFGPPQSVLGANETHRSVVRLSDLKLGYGRVILAACDDDELAYEADGHGIFTRALMNSMSNADGLGKTITISELYDSIAREVVETSRGRQTPVIYGRQKLASIPRMQIQNCSG